MLHQQKMRLIKLNLPALVACFAVLLTLVAPAAFAQGLPSRFATLSIGIFRANAAVVRLKVQRPDTLSEALTDALRQSLRGGFVKMPLAYDAALEGYDAKPEEILIYYRWQAPQIQNYLYWNIEIDFTPLRKALKQRGIPNLLFVISLPEANHPYVMDGNDTPLPKPASYHGSRIKNMVGFSRKIPTDGNGIWSIARIGYERDANNVSRVVGILGGGFLLLNGVGLFLWRRAWKAKSANPAAAPFGFTQKKD